MNLKERLLSSIYGLEMEKLHVASTRECNCATLNSHIATSYATSEQPEDSHPLLEAYSDATLDATSMQRMRIFMQLGLDKISSQELIVRLSMRDADWDSRYWCYECLAIRWIGSSQYICTNARSAGVMSKTFSLGDGTGYAKQLQRCDGFKSALAMA